MPNGLHSQAPSETDTGPCQPVRKTEELQVDWHGGAHGWVPMASPGWVPRAGRALTCTHGDALEGLGVDIERCGQLRDSAPDQGPRSAVWAAREGPQGRDILLPYLDQSPPGTPKPLDAGARVTISFSVCGPSWPKAGLDKAGSQVVQAVLGWRLPRGSEGTWVPLLFLSRPQKSTREK